MTQIDNYFTIDKIEAGCDEAGRGCLAGSVFAAAVILPKDFHHKLLNDSKQMSEKSRYLLRDIIEKEAISWAVAEVSAERIDKINILNASFEGMNNAVKMLSIRPELLLIDGNRFKTDLDIPYECIVKGDSKFTSIAAASVLAKTYRDDYIIQLDKDFPMYDWKNNKAYPTKKHREAIEIHGICKHHRLSYGNLGQLSIPLKF